MTLKPPETVRQPHPVVGIIGGMGPEATVDLMRRVIAKTPAEDDCDHIHLIVESNPKIPSRMAHLIDGTGPDPTPELVRIAFNLERAGAHVLAMPCNTAHAYAGAVRHAVSIPFLDMAVLTAESLAARAPRARVGVLASSAVLRIGLYARALAERGHETVLPQDQQSVMELIRDVKRGDSGVTASRRLATLAEELSRQCDILLIACTDLSAIASDILTPAIDAADVLAEAILSFAAISPVSTARATIV